MIVVQVPSAPHIQLNSSQASTPPTPPSTILPRRPDCSSPHVHLHTFHPQAILERVSSHSAAAVPPLVPTLRQPPHSGLPFQASPQDLRRIQGNRKAKVPKQPSSSISKLRPRNRTISALTVQLAFPYGFLFPVSRHVSHSELSIRDPKKI